MIGIFDTGLGGIGIYKEIKKLLPKENIFYYADNKNAPYGPRSSAEIKHLALKSLKYLEKQGCDLIVIACNTATVSGVGYFRQHMRLPIIGTVPVIKTAARETKNKKVALLATQKTVQSHYINKLIKKFAAGIKVKKIACPGWVEAIENNKVTDKILKKYLQKIQDEDIIILGCTHYPLIKKQIQKLIKSRIKIIDSNAAVARQVKRVMALENLFQPHQKPKYIFQGSDKKQNLTIKVKKYL
jgi:glutamate racemase